MVAKLQQHTAEQGHRAQGEACSVLDSSDYMVYELKQSNSFIALCRTVRSMGVMAHLRQISTQQEQDRLPEGEARSASGCGHVGQDNKKQLLNKSYSVCRTA